MRIACSRAGGCAACLGLDGDVGGIETAVVLGVGDDSLGLHNEGLLSVIDEVLGGLDVESAGDVPVSVGPLDLAVVDDEVLGAGVGDQDDDSAEDMGVAADDGLIEREGDGLREALENLEGTCAAELDLLACHEARL